MSRSTAAAHDFWVLIPAYNEEPTVREVAARARRYCAHVLWWMTGPQTGRVKPSPAWTSFY